MYLRMMHERPTSCPAPRGIISTRLRCTAGPSSALRLAMLAAASSSVTTCWVQKGNYYQCCSKTMLSKLQVHQGQEVFLFTHPLHSPFQPGNQASFNSTLASLAHSYAKIVQSIAMGAWCRSRFSDTSVTQKLHTLVITDHMMHACCACCDAPPALHKKTVWTHTKGAPGQGTDAALGPSGACCHACRAFRSVWQQCGPAGYTASSPFPMAPLVFFSSFVCIGRCSLRRNQVCRLHLGTLWAT